MWLRKTLIAGTERAKDWNGRGIVCLWGMKKAIEMSGVREGECCNGGVVRAGLLSQMKTHTELAQWTVVEEPPMAPWWLLEAGMEGLVGISGQWLGPG